MTNAFWVEHSKGNRVEPLVNDLIEELKRWGEIFKWQLPNWQPA